MENPYIVRCNDCNPKARREFRTEKEAQEWGHNHEILTRLEFSGHTVHFAMKAGI